MWIYYDALLRCGELLPKGLTQAWERKVVCVISEELLYLRDNIVGNCAY